MTNIQMNIHLDKKQLQTDESLPTNFVTSAPSELWQSGERSISCIDTEAYHVRK